MTTNLTEPNSNEAKLAALRYADARVLLDILSADLGEPTSTLSQYPAWVIRCGRKVARASYPLAYTFKEGIQPTPYQIGFALGMMVGSEEKMTEALTKLNLTIDHEPTQEEINALTDFLFGKNSGATLPEDGSSLIPIEVREDFKRWESEMNLEQKGEFHRGLSDTLLMIAGKNQFTPATARYATMLIYWKIVDAMQSMEQLHEFLIKVHGQNIVGSDIKGTRQLCQRVGKRFKAPGRPKLPQAPRRLR